MSSDRQGTVSTISSVRQAVAGDIARLAGCDFSFLVAEAVPGPFDGPRLGRTVSIEPAYHKSYGFDAQELATYLDGEGRALLVTETEDGRPVGYAAVSRGWNDYAFVDDIAVDANHRGSGLARQLMDAVVTWASGQGLPGIRLETQSNNVGACRFYERYGFVLAGYDRHLYQALDPGTEEIALFWYLLFRDAKPHRD